MTDPRPDEPESHADPAARPLRRLRPEEPPPAVPHSAAAPLVLALAWLSGVCGVLLALTGLAAGKPWPVGIGLQGVVAAVILYAFSVIVHRVEEIAYWARRAAEQLERRGP